MTEVLSIILLLILFGCEFKIPYSIDGAKHELIINPKKHEHADGQ